MANVIITVIIMYLVSFSIDWAVVHGLWELAQYLTGWGQEPTWQVSFVVVLAANIILGVFRR